MNRSLQLLHDQQKLLNRDPNALDLVLLALILILHLSDNRVIVHQAEPLGGLLENLLPVVGKALDLCLQGVDLGLQGHVLFLDLREVLLQAGA